MMYWGNHMSGGDWVFSILGMLIVLALIVGAVVWLVSALSDHGSGTVASLTSAREILDRRFAVGELTVEQYERLRETLSDVPSTTRDPQPSPPAGAPE